MLTILVGIVLLSTFVDADISTQQLQRSNTALLKLLQEVQAEAAVGDDCVPDACGICGGDGSLCSGPVDDDEEKWAAMEAADKAMEAADKAAAFEEDEARTRVMGFPTNCYLKDESDTSIHTEKDGKKMIFCGTFETPLGTDYCCDGRPIFTKRSAGCTYGDECAGCQEENCQSEAYYTCTVGGKSDYPCTPKWIGCTGPRC